MQLTVLGRCGPYPRANEACSGYLVRAGQTALLLDCGAGVLSRLRALIDIASLDAVVLSHLHYDHCADMGVLRYALEQNQRAPLPVYCPAEPAAAAAMLQSPVFDVRTLHDGLRAEVGALKLAFGAVAHPVPCFGVAVAAAEARLFYTGDTGWFDGLIPLARGADALLCDCCFTDADAAKPAVHLSGRQASRLAREAGAKRLYATHVPGGADNDAALQDELDFHPSAVVQEWGSYELSFQ